MPLQLAIETSQTTLFRLLLKGGADIDLAGSTNESCRQMVHKSGNEEMVNIMSEFVVGNKLELNTTEILSTQNSNNLEIQGDNNELGKKKKSKEQLIEEIIDRKKEHIKIMERVFLSENRTVEMEE